MHRHHHLIPSANGYPHMPLFGYRYGMQHLPLFGNPYGFPLYGNQAYGNSYGMIGGQYTSAPYMNVLAVQPTQNVQQQTYNTGI